VGSHAPITVDVRVVAATHRDLDHEVREGRFREDLLYRLNVHVLKVPALRERLTDIPLLADHFAARAAEQMGRPQRPLTDAARARLASYDWRRNNVRELRNVLERMVLAARGDVIDVDAVPADIGPTAAIGADGSGSGGSSGWHPGLGTLEEQRKAAERAIVQDALERHDWHITNTARALGLADHSSLLKTMRRLGLKR
jgi:DNA-binding NtrC family response regulator